jgi:D-alanyl-D-alanine carboxypeptidase
MLLLLSVGLLAQTPAFPSTPKGDFARRYVEAFNAGEPAMKAFLDTLPPGAPPVADRLARYRQIRTDLGPIVPTAPPTEVADGVEMRCLDRQGQPLRLTVVITGPAPLQLGGLRAEPADQPREAPAPTGPPIDERTMLEQVGALVDARVAADAFSGTVLLAHGNRLVWQGAYGLADRDTKRPVTIDTRFDVGSIAKLFTRIAIAQLAEAGRVHLDDTVGRFLPAYPNATVRDTVTIAQLLDMRSGLGDFFGPNFQATDRSHIRSLQDYLPLFVNEPLLFAPGAKEAYSNAGYIVLGLVIEAISHQSYYDYVETHIFQPAGMRATAFGFRDRPAPNTAVGYSKRNPAASGGWASNLEMMPARGSSAGSFQSTAPDFQRFVEALAAGTVLSADAARRLDIHPRALGIAGGAPGLNAELDSGLGTGYTLVVLSNQDPPSAEDLARQIRALLRRTQ